MKRVIMGAAITAAIALIGEMEFQDAQQQDQRYCDMVEAGHWPDYQPEINCDTENGSHAKR